MIAAGFHPHRLRGGAHPATPAADEAEMQVTIAYPNLAFPLLPVQMQLARFTREVMPAFR